MRLARSGCRPEQRRLLGRWRRSIACGGLIIALSASAAHAEAAAGSHGSEVLLLVQVALLIGVGRGLGELMQRVGQPSVLGELLGGLMLGPSLLGWLWPSAQAAIFPHEPAQTAMIEGLAQFGILLLLLLTGMEVDLKLVRQVGRPAVTISVFGIALPFACGFALGQWMPQTLLPHPEARLVASLFLGTALSISSVKIVAVVVREMNFMRRNVGQIIVASAIIDDTLGWIIIAVIFSLASRGSLDLRGIAQSVVGTLLFLSFSFTIGRRLVSILIRLANDHLVSASPVVTVILLLMSIMALITHLIGVHTVLGAFVTGVLVGESPILTRQIDERLRGLITSLFMPVFFGLAGLGTDLTQLRTPDLLLFTAGLVVVASLGKFAGALAGGTLGGLTRDESLALASGMNARGSTEVIIASIGLSMGVLSQPLFTMIVTMAVLTTLAMPPMLRAALRRLPPDRSEQARLEREAYERTGFMGSLERLLLAADDSNSGRLAARIAGLLAGPGGRPVTVIDVGRLRHAVQPPVEADGPSRSEAVVKDAAQQGARRTQTDGDVDVTTRAPAVGLHEAVEEEARKGFDLMLIGIEQGLMSDGKFSPACQEIASGFEGPLGLAFTAANASGEPAQQPNIRILVPVSGRGVSRGGAQVAIALAHAQHAALHLLYVSTTRGSGSGERSAEEQDRANQVLSDNATAARRYDLQVTTSTAATAPDVAILDEAARIGADLIVLGVDRLQGPTLDFGAMIAAVLANSKVPLLVVSAGMSTTARRNDP
ncbi:Sodium/hydrogen exchanger precursor [Bradyrhizobium sp. ORS 375]|uniref:cation:proton antiporter domain-containing protein n=1 Tax=Bradyrhizobium sp. (strain ORS 375) TaxID=566679 RepID=UPI0002407A31|nr:cation:proton antiporter [Bradyrhizobium sp. ORS 375]CCD92598.1 Sodium/hydrogen exchanger precursor [Bradyrhizobium sp. ORS 375]